MFRTLFVCAALSAMLWSAGAQAQQAVAPSDSLLVNGSFTSGSAETFALPALHIFAPRAAAPLPIPVPAPGMALTFGVMALAGLAARHRAR